MGLEGVAENKMMGLRLILRHKRSKSFPDKKKVEEDNPDNHLEATDRMKLPQLQYLLLDCQKTRQSANQLNMEFWHQTLIIGMQIRVTPQSQFHVHQLQHLLPICPKIHQATNQPNMEVFLLKRVQIKVTARNQFHQPR